MKIVALIAALGMSAAATASVKPTEPARSSNPLLVLTSYKAPPAKQQLQKGQAAKPTPYIYKAPMATRPLKTW